MTEEQRWRQQQQIEVDRNKCLKGIWDELKNIAGLMKIQTCVSPVIAGTRFTENDLTSLVKALEKPAQFVPTVEEVPEPPKPSDMSKEERIEFTKKTINRPADFCRYEDYSNALDKQRDGDYRDARFNGEWHGEHIDPSDPSRK